MKLRALSQLKFDKVIREMGQSHATDVETMKHFVEVLVRMRRDSTTLKAMTKLFVAARAMSRKFTGSDLHGFVMMILQNEEFLDDRLHVARQLYWFALDPGIILDSFFKEQVNWVSLYKYLDCRNEPQIIESLDVVVKLLDKPVTQIKEQMLQFEWVAPEFFYGKAMEEMFSEVRIQRCVKKICLRYKLQLPTAYRRRFLRVTLDQELEAYNRGEVEDEDFLYSFNVICGEETDVEEEAMTYVSGVAGPLGQYVREMRRPTVSRGGPRLAKRQVCRQPFNQALHQVDNECGEALSGGG
jgi:hypothetical protein